MKRSAVGLLTVYALVFVGLLAANVRKLRGQYTQNKAQPKVDTSKYPADIQGDYRLFESKCSECHTLSSSLNVTMSPVEWGYWVKQMEHLPSSHISNQDATRILAFLNYEDAHRKAAPPNAASAAPGQSAGPVALGRQFYFTHNCDLCHVINGQGGSAGPDLSNVGNRMTRQQLTKRMQDRRAGTAMPPLAPDTTDQQIGNLVDFLLTLKGRQ